MDERESSTTIQVERADQDRINEFGRLNDDMDGMKFELSQLKTQLANLEEASDELLLADEADGGVQCFVGSSFFTLSREEAEKRLGDEKEQLQTQAGELETRIAANEQKLAQLKVTLKAKFRDAINLDA
jgi:chaperonin cofactor prefoldin